MEKTTKKKTEKEAGAASLRSNPVPDESKRKKGKAAKSLPLNEAILEALPIGVCLTDEGGYYRFMNDAYCAVYEYVREEMIGQHYSVIMPPDQIALANAHYERLLGGDTGIPAERKRQRKDGSIIYIEAANALVMDGDGRKMVITTIRDITDRKQIEADLKAANEAYQTLHATLREQATRDSLTGLYNRRYFNETIERELARAGRDNSPVCVMIMDIDLFKQINDTYGHTFGDDTLKVLGALITANIRAGDIAFRYGGDEFVIVMPGVEVETARQRMEMVRQSFNAVPIMNNQLDFGATISVGISSYPANGRDGNEILRAADAALYQAKQAGRNCIRIWESE